MSATRQPLLMKEPLFQGNCTIASLYDASCRTEHWAIAVVLLAFSSLSFLSLLIALALSIKKTPRITPYQVTRSQKVLGILLLGSLFWILALTINTLVPLPLDEARILHFTFLSIASMFTFVFIQYYIYITLDLIPKKTKVMQSVQFVRKWVLWGGFVLSIISTIGNFIRGFPLANDDYPTRAILELILSILSVLAWSCWLCILVYTTHILSVVIRAFRKSFRSDFQVIEYYYDDDYVTSGDSRLEINRRSRSTQVERHPMMVALKRLLRSFHVFVTVFSIFLLNLVAVISLNLFDAGDGFVIIILFLIVPYSGCQLISLSVAVVSMLGLDFSLLDNLLKKSAAASNVEIYF